jgi:hypothetical protein
VADHEVGAQAGLVAQRSGDPVQTTEQSELWVSAWSEEMSSGERGALPASPVAGAAGAAAAAACADVWAASAAATLNAAIAIGLFIDGISLIVSVAGGCGRRR